MDLSTAQSPAISAEPGTRGKRTNRTQMAIDWFDANSDAAYSLIRIYVGVALFVRGWIFVADSEAAIRLVTQQGGDWLVPIVIVHYVALAHIVGGLMLAAGFFARLGAAVQIPILIGATFFVHLSQGLVAPGQSLELSALVLFLLLLFFAFGSGRWSADRYLHKPQKSDSESDRSLA